MPTLAVASRLRLAVVLVVLLSIIAPVGASSPEVISPNVRISQVYMGGGNISSTYKCDFVELFNASASPVSLNGWSIQNAPGAGSSWVINTLGNISIGGSSYLLMSGSCGSGSQSLPTADVLQSGASRLMAFDSGRVALVSKETLLSGLGDEAVVDFVGYGAAAVQYEGAGPAPAHSTTTAIFRNSDGCDDSDQNTLDFTVGPPAPRNSASPTHSCADPAPSVSLTTPENGASGVPLDTNLTISFSEPVDVMGDWFHVACDLAGARGPTDALVTGGPTDFTIDLSADLFGDDLCSVTVRAANVADQDANDPPDTPAADYVFSFRTAGGACGAPAYYMGAIQGASDASPVAGETRTVEGVVVGDFQGAEKLSGFFVQEEAADADADPLTSEALFVDEGAASTLDVLVGDRVRVTGVVTEVDGLTTLTNLTGLTDCGAADLPPSTNIMLPVPTADAWEPYEGMRITVPQSLTVTGTDDLAAFGSVRLVQGERLWQYTQTNAPDVAGFAAFGQEAALRSITLDDGSSLYYPDPIVHPEPGLSAGHTLRVGDTLPTGLTGVIQQTDGEYLIQPVESVPFTASNPRPSAPQLPAANVRVAGVNLGNYFNGNGSGDFTTSYGANSSAEFTRQRDKLINALLALDAGILGVTQIENDSYDGVNALDDLVDGMNAASTTGSYAYINPGAGVFWGSDAATVGIIYNPARVTPIGGPRKPETGAFTQPPLSQHVPMAQTFEEAEWGEQLTIVVNDLPVRDGCPVDGPDADHGDGQGCWNALRTQAAEELLVWLATDPTASGDPDFLLVGDYNAFAREAPITTLLTGGYTDLIARGASSSAYSTVWDGLSGYSDHALASATLLPQAIGAEPWHHNADEPGALDYNLENKSVDQQATLYGTDPYRAASHDAVLVGLSLLADQSDLGGDYGVAWHTGQGVWRLGALWGAQAEGGPDPDDGVVRGDGSWNDGQGEVTVTITGPASQYICLHAWLDYTGGTPPPGMLHTPDGQWGAGEKVIAGLPLLPGADQLVTFEIPVGALDGSARYNMRFRLIPAPDPLAPTCTSPSAAHTDAEPLGPTGRADGGEVEDYSFEPGPLAVEIVSFEGRAVGEDIVLTWETNGEQDLLGFDIYRSVSADGPWVRLNEGLIPARAPGASQGAVYTFRDAIPPAGPWYRLEALESGGARHIFGPIQARTGVPTSLNLTAIDAQTVLFAFWPVTFTLILLAFTLLGLRRLRNFSKPRS